MRQYGEVPPVLSTAQPPAVSATTGLGTGGGAAVQSKGSPSDGQGFGHINIQAGSNPSASWSITLSFPQTPPTLFFAGDSGAALTFTVSGQGTQTITLSGSTAFGPNRRHTIAYEWSVSQ